MNSINPIKKLFKINPMFFLKHQISLLFSVTMEPHCSLKKKKNLLALLYNKFHQLN